MSQFDQSCRSCRALQGLEVLSLAPRIHDGKFWMIEHVHPTNIKGWLVIVLKRHCEAIHDLRPKELEEFSRLMPLTCQALHAVLGTEKEYVAQFAEGMNFNHVHFHVIARMPEWRDKWKGPKIFRNCLGEDVEGKLGREEMTAIALEIQKCLENLLLGRSGDHLE